MPAGRGNSFADSGLLNALFKHDIVAEEKFLHSTVLTVTLNALRMLLLLLLERLEPGNVHM